MRFLERRRDRRRGYSFLGHFKRVKRTKGLRHIALSTLSTVMIVGLTFAYCSGDGITGPTGNGSQVAATPATGGSQNGGEGGDDGAIDPGLLIIPIDIGPPTAIETQFGPINLPIDMQATACNKDVVAWDPSRTYVTMSGYMALNPTTGAVRIKGHFVQRAYGTGTIVMPTRRYTGYEVYDKDFVLVPPVSANEEEFLLKIIAKGNIEPWPLYPQDDYVFYVRVRTVMVAGVVRVESVKAYTKCW